MTSDELQQQATRIRLIADAPPAVTPGQQKLVRAKAEAVTRLIHPAIVPILELGFNQDGAPYVVTECIDEPTLADVLKTEQLDEATVLDYSIQICEAISAAHIAGVAHGNLNAENVYVCDVDGMGNQIRVANFGIPGATAAKSSFPNDVEALGRLMAKALHGIKVRPEFENVVLFCLEENAEERYKDCREVLSNLLLVRQGKLPEPPKHRPGQKFVTPLVVVIGVLAAIMITVAAFMALQSSRQAVGIPSAAEQRSASPAQPVPAALPAPAAPAQTVKPVSSLEPASAWTPERARARYGLNSTASPSTFADRKAKVKHAAGKAVEHKDKAKRLWQKFHQ